MDWLRDYVDFGGQDGARQQQPAALRRGMSMDEVQEMLGNGKLLSESVGTDGILSQQWEFVTGGRVYSLTAVEGLLVKYAMKSR